MPVLDFEGMASAAEAMIAVEHFLGVVMLALIAALIDQLRSIFGEKDNAIGVWDRGPGGKRKAEGYLASFAFDEISVKDKI